QTTARKRAPPAQAALQFAKTVYQTAAARIPRMATNSSGIPACRSNLARRRGQDHKKPPHPLRGAVEDRSGAESQKHEAGLAVQWAALHLARCDQLTRGLPPPSQCPCRAHNKKDR